MAGEFSETTLGRLLSFANGRSSPERSDGLPYPVYGSNGVIGYATEANADEGSIIIGRVGSYCGSLYISKQRCWVTDNAIRATALDYNDSRFLFYLLSTLGLNNWRAGSGQPLLNQDILSRIPASAPEPAEQRAIAHILGTLDDKIELNRRMSETLEAMARALFKSWFVDFNPVRAKAEGRDPGLPKHLADLFPDSFEESELGEIPRGWEVGSILKHARLLSGGTPKTDRAEYWDGPILWASAKDVSQSSSLFLIDTERNITERGLDESATQVVPAFCSAVVARGATTGRMVLFGRDMAMNQTCYALATTTETPFALYCRLRQEVDALVHAAHGSVFDTITTSTFASSRIVLPSPSALKAFEVRIAPLFQKVLNNVSASRTLTALRDALLLKLISGELRIQDAKRFIKGKEDGSN